MDSIILIGMPGSGKSTLGRKLARRLDFNFIDTDLLIETHQRKKLQTIVDQQGYLTLREIESQELQQLQLDHNVVATGGSAVYSNEAMKHLQKQGVIVYLKVDFKEIVKRIDNESCRGIARPADQNLQSVYAERTPLYERFADVTMDNNRPLSLDKVVNYLNIRSV